MNSVPYKSVMVLCVHQLIHVQIKLEMYRNYRNYTFSKLSILHRSINE